MAEVVCFSKLIISKNCVKCRNFISIRECSERNEKSDSILKLRKNRTEFKFVRKGLRFQTERVQNNYTQHKNTQYTTSNIKTFSVIMLSITTPSALRLGIMTYSITIKTIQNSQFNHLTNYTDVHNVALSVTMLRAVMLSVVMLRVTATFKY